MVKLTQELLKELLRYNKSTGVFTWKRRDRKHFKNDGSWKTWNIRFSYQQTGYTSNSGYVYTLIFGNPYLTHRLAWLHVHGNWPIEIDHINGVRSDNRIVNLRSVSSEINKKNSRLLRNNTSGYHGISWNKAISRWKVRISNKYLGSYSDLQEAVKVRKQAEKDNHYHPNHGRV